MRSNFIRNELAIYWLTLSACLNGVYFGGKYGFPGLVDRVDTTISYAERVLVEEEAAKTSNDEFIRSVEGFGSGELTFYRHDVEPYSLKVAQQ